MATKYLDVVGGDDVGGNGTALLPYKTLSKASTEAGTGGQVNDLGVQWRTFAAAATWTEGSATVTVAGDETAKVAAGDYLFADEGAGIAKTRRAHRVQAVSYGAPTTTITLYRVFCGDTGNYTSHAFTAKLVVAQVFSAQNVVLTGGWKNDDTQPADYVSAWEPASAITILADSSRGCLAAEGRFFLLRGNIGYSITAGRWTGVLDVSECNYGVYSIGGGCHVHGGVLTSSYNTNAGLSVSDGYVEAAILDNNLRGILLNNAGSGLGYALIRRATDYVAVNSKGWLGELHTEDCAAKNIVNAADTYGLRPSLRIGQWVSDVARVFQNMVFCGAPPAGYINKVFSGTSTLVTGRAGGADSAISMNPDPVWSGKQIPLIHECGFNVAVGKVNPVLTLWAKYTGTTAPECWVFLVEPNGLSPVRQTFVPTTGWAQYSFTLTGTVLQSGAVRAAICVLDNAAADAVLLVDDIAVAIS